MTLSRYGYLRVAASTPELRVADVNFNANVIKKVVREAAEQGCSLIVFPELCLTGYTCGDLFYQKKLLDSAFRAAVDIAVACTSDNSIIAIVGLPVTTTGRLFNCAAVLAGGEIKGIVPKSYLCNTREYYEERWFSSEFDRNTAYISVNGQEIPFGADLLFDITNIPDCTFGVEICEDLWALIPPSFSMAAAGANIICNLSASNEMLGKMAYRQELVKSQSARCFSAYVYSASGPGESSTDLVFSGHSIIAENGVLAAQTERFCFETQIIASDIDIELLNNERICNNSFGATLPQLTYRRIEIVLAEAEVDSMNRAITPLPFVPQNKDKKNDACSEIFSIQSTGLAKRLKHIGTENAVIGISGGLDSTLALLVIRRAFDILGLSPKGIKAITMPGFGTTKRTKNNASELAKALGASLLTIPIVGAVNSHFKDIGHNPAEHDVVFENAQARERTQILMDIANQVGGIVIGTGDLSEIALGWATFNGDHIAMYSVNSGVPKTLVKSIIEWAAEKVFVGKIAATLKDVIETPISPELLPPDSNGDIIQKTENELGPYEMHDFILYYAIRYKFAPEKIFMLAEIAFNGKYSRENLKKWLEIFYKRFFSHQFKRSCMPDGVKIGSVALSPRGDWRMPSDAEVALWMDAVKSI